MFLLYINDLSDNLQYNPVLFADDTSLFSTVKVQKNSHLNNHLKLINKLTFEWEKSFNIDPKKQSQKVMFSKMFFNNILVSKSDCEKHLGLHLDSKSSFDIVIKTILTKVNRTIGSLQKLQHYLDYL